MRAIWLWQVFLLGWPMAACSDQFSNPNNMTQYVFDATVDHFSFRNPKTFPLRYFVEDNHWKPDNGGPIFFYAGNEAPITQFIDSCGFLSEIAAEFGAMVVFAEHRYYGESFPDQTDLSFLTVEQAMADFNTLTVHIRQKWKVPSSSAFVVFGGSYGGNLALWLRLKNPNIWTGAIASSATPLKHLLREENGFTLIETQVYGNVSTACPALIREGWVDLYRLLANTENSDGSKKVAEALGLCRCENLSAEIIHGWVSDALETLVQYGYPYPTNYYQPVPAYPFAVACHRMERIGNGLGALRAAVDVFYNFTGQAGECYDYESSVRLGSARYWHRRGAWSHQSSFVYDQQKKNLRNFSLEEAWGYQTCTEVYQPMPTDGVTDFEVPYAPNQTLYFAECMARYGVQPRPNWEELTFMGSNIGSGTNIFLTNGQLDPWRAAGIQWQPKGSTEATITVRTIENGAHHYDLRASHPDDTTSVVLVRQEEKDAIRRWLHQWRDNSQSVNDAPQVATSS